jgi:hypothetical protein
MIENKLSHVLTDSQNYISAAENIRNITATN